MDLTFVDTGAFIALFDQPDHLHQQARETYATLAAARSALVTTNHVIDEACTWLLRHTRNGHQMAVHFGEAVVKPASSLVADGLTPSTISSTRLTIVYTTPAIERAAWDIFGRYETAGFSFTDCVSFATMEALGIKKAFTFDKHYDTMGFTRL